MTSLVGFPLGTIYNITGISRDIPGVVTLDSVADPYSFAIANGQTVTISKVIGMYQVNDLRCVVGSFDPDVKTFQMYDLWFHPLDTRLFNAYIEGGQINIISYPPTATNPAGLMYNNQ